jgi:tRNA dimethylallyltransferase
MASDALVITGPTAVGKTAIGILVAKRLGAEIVSMDSRQVYRGMDIGTAKPTLAEREGIPHFGFDLVSPAERYSAGRFARDARNWIAGIRERGHVALLVGGTGFFLRALTHPLFREPELAPEHRAGLDRFLREQDAEELRRWAEALDPRAAGMRAGGRQRLQRVIEVALLTGHPITWWHAHAPGSDPLSAHIVVLERPRAVLVRRIDDRVERMLASGLADEVRELLAEGYTLESPGMNATGYAELVPYVRGERTLAEAVAMTRAATRRYARRQMTWFRNQLPPGAVRLDAERPPQEVADTIVELWRKEAES